MPLVVERHDGPPPLAPEWEEVVEASFIPAGPRCVVVGCTGPIAAEFDLAVGVDHRVRYCARGMDAARAADVRGSDEPEIDRYLLQFWPAPVAADDVIRQTSAAAAYWNGVAQDLPSAAEVARRRAEVNAREEARRRAEQDEEQRQWLAREERLLWHGPRPDGPLAEVGDAPTLAGWDRPLLDALAAASAARLRVVGRFAARRAMTEAGMAEIDWVAAGLAALDAGHVLPPPFDDDAQVWRVLGDDRRVPMTMVRSPDGLADNWNQQYMSLPALMKAAEADPLGAAVGAVVHAAIGLGFDNRAAFLADVHDVLVVAR